MDQEDGMPFASMAEFRSVVLLPWDLNLVMFLGQFLRCLDVQRLKSNAEHVRLGGGLAELFIIGRCIPKS